MPTIDSEQFRRQLLELRARITGEVGSLVDAIQDENSGGGNASSNPNHPADIATGVDTDLDLLHNEQAILGQIDESLARIAAGKFGLCEECDKPIAAARLEAIPYTPFCIGCASAQEATG